MLDTKKKKGKTIFKHRGQDAGNKVFQKFRVKTLGQKNNIKHKNLVKGDSVLMSIFYH